MRTRLTLSIVTGLALCALVVALCGCDSRLEGGSSETPRDKLSSAETGSGQNVPNPLASLEEQATSGDPSAQVNLGTKYQHGGEVPRDFAKACYWFQKAADQGDPIGQCNYGTMLVYGMGCKKDQAKAKALFEKAAGKGCKYGYYELGVVYDQGLGVPPDYKKASDYYRKAAVAGVPEAMNNLANMRAHGHLKADWSAPDMYKEAAMQGNNVAEFNLGMLYLGGNGVPQSDKSAVEWLTKAAEHGNVDAQCNLGMILANGGKGVPAQTDIGIKWLKKAAASGDVLAKKGLARIYHEGRGVKKDEQEAARWWPQPLP